MSASVQNVRNTLDSAIATKETELAKLKEVRATLRNIPDDLITITTPRGRPSAKSTKFMIEAGKRGRGRPVGSTNKPKSNSVVAD